MKRTHDSIVDLTRDPDPNPHRLHPFSHCAICRHALAEDCLQCTPTHHDKPKVTCQGSVKNAACEHSFHTECIARWLDTHNCCPLCCGDWIYPWNLSLSEIAALKAVGDEGKIVDIVSTGELNPRIYAILDAKLRIRPPAKERKLSHLRQRLLARTFALYLNTDELKDLLAWKSHGIDMVTNKTKK